MDSIKENDEGMNDDIDNNSHMSSSCIDRQEDIPSSDETIDSHGHVDKINHPNDLVLDQKDDEEQEICDTTMDSNVDIDIDKTTDNHKVSKKDDSSDEVRYSSRSINISENTHEAEEISTNVQVLRTYSRKIRQHVILDDEQDNLMDVSADNVIAMKTDEERKETDEMEEGLEDEESMDSVTGNAYIYTDIC